jgi:hypothetical protein
MSSMTQIEGLPYYQMSISINHGNSGGPVIDSKGSVIGVATAVAAMKEGIAFCIPVDDVRKGIVSARSATKKSLSEVGARHRATVTFKSLNTMGRFYGLALEAYNGAIRAAVQRGLGVADGLRMASREMDDKLKKLDDALFADVASTVPTVTVDASVPPNARQHLTDLWSNVQSMKEFFRNPTGNQQGIRARTNALQKRHDELTHALRADLGLPPDEDEPKEKDKPEDDPSEKEKGPPQIEIVDLSGKPDSVHGVIKIYGRIKNLTQKPLENITATIHIVDAGTKQLLGSVQATVVPTTLQPGTSGTIFAQSRPRSAQEMYFVKFTTVKGEPIPSSFPGREKYGRR